MTKKSEKKAETTPLMKQYGEIKAAHPDAILLFRVGDFYETFGEDAIKASRILGITLTQRSGIELAGVPHHAIENYLPKLIRAGERVAVCEQLEDPKSVKGIVKRGVVELVTPGVVMNETALTTSENTFLAAVYFGDKQTGVAFLDISTGQFFVAEGSDEYTDKLLANLAPKEVLYQRGYEERMRMATGGKLNTYRLDGWVFTEGSNRDKLCKQFGTPSLKGFGIDTLTAGISAAGAILNYLELTEHRNITHIRSISRIDEREYVWLDRFTMRNLELFVPSASDGRSFASVIDQTLTPMGSRLLKQWIALPLKDEKRINERLDVVSALVFDGERADELGELMTQIGDLERLAARIATGRILPREVVQLGISLGLVEKLQRVLNEADDKKLKAIGAGLRPLQKVREKIETMVFAEPATNQIQKGGVIADGVDKDLDELRRIASHSKELLLGIQRRESERTGIPSLKVSFNNIFGYYIEVRNAHRERVPEDWIRKQTLTEAERYITPELKQYEEKILGAEARIQTIEEQIYYQLIGFLGRYIADYQYNAAAISRLDCLASFARTAVERHYARPTIASDKVLDITDGRHPVIETMMELGKQYIPNDTFLDPASQQIIIITGPNMSGKSALLRQTALITLMAQMGSFVPAREAHIGLVDKIFTRVGASDNISAGESTFMVEMLEAASILNNATDRSLVLLDEIGRGTSTYDGISISWAMVEYLHTHPRAQAKTMFATHYHELNELEAQLERVKNFNVSVKELGNQIIFLRKLVAGGTEHSFGIHVARMAGMPSEVVTRAEEVLKILEHTQERDSEQLTKATKMADKETKNYQLSMFQLDDPVLIQVRDQIKGLDVNNLTPLEALNLLAEIKKIVNG